MLRAGGPRLAIVLAALIGLGAGWLLLPGCHGPESRPVDARPVSVGGVAAGQKDLRTAARGANVVVCVIDAARADHVGCYGYPRETTPNIDRLATEGIVFGKHFAQFPETKPSTASLFTGQHADTHLAYDRRTIDPDSFTLAKGLKAAGYRTVLFSQNEYASPLWGLGTEFDEAYYEPHLKARGRDIPEIWRPEALLELIARWTEETPGEPFFAYVHFMPPHSPYIGPPEMKLAFAGKEPPEMWESPFPFDGIEPKLRRQVRGRSQARYLNMYDGHLRYADWAVGELERLLREAGVFEDTVFIVTSDHGEAFGEHGYWGHTFSAFDESIHIPLVVGLPGPERAVGRVSGLTQTVDLLPTVLDLLGIPCSGEAVQGRSLLPLVCGEVGEVNEYVYARAAGEPASYVVRDQNALLVLYEGGGLRALYDLESDPRAVRNAIERDPELARRMTEAFREFAERQAAPPLNFVDADVEPRRLTKRNEVEVTEEMKRSLKALGYLD